MGTLFSGAESVPKALGLSESFSVTLLQRQPAPFNHPNTQQIYLAKLYSSCPFKASHDPITKFWPMRYKQICWGEIFKKIP